MINGQYPGFNGGDVIYFDKPTRTSTQPDMIAAKRVIKKILRSYNHAVKRSLDEPATRHHGSNIIIANNWDIMLPEAAKHAYYKQSLYDFVTSEEFREIVNTLQIQIIENNPQVIDEIPIFIIT